MQRTQRAARAHTARTPAGLVRAYDLALTAPAGPPDPGAAPAAAPAPRPEISDSWLRLRRLGLDPDTGRNARRIGTADLERRRHDSQLGQVLPLLRATLLGHPEDAPVLLAVADPEGHLLWIDGARPLRRSADGIGFDKGARWTEDEVGTNGIGMAMRTERPTSVHSAEHYLRSHHAWTCVAAPVRDPRTGRMLAVLDLSGPAQQVQPHLLRLTATAARLAEAELRAVQLESLHRLRTLAAPLLARVSGPAMVVDGAGWTAAAVGVPPVPRLRLPAEGWGSAAVQWLPAFGQCAVEPLGGGWLVRPLTAAPAVAEQNDGARIHLDLRRPGRPELHVRGAAGSWSHTLSPRHAEVLLLLAVRRTGLSAAQLADGLFGDPARTVTVRAELSRLRRYLGALLDHRPYRLAGSAEVSVSGPADPLDLLVTSAAPAVRELRAALLAGTARLPGAPAAP
ncbi:GAF domain-containing protein [Kitasatospora sp. NPDC059571]|uniref:helix-turn-helix domain-containing protein n=1 Tax=Kitasatospora sp. NPDC059571 TaxID=3346871 RepID=UPI0036AA0600